MAAPAEFTTWTDYQTKVLNAMVAGVAAGAIALQSISLATPDGETKSFKNLLEWERHVDFVANKVAIENGATDKRGRRLFLAAVR